MRFFNRDERPFGDTWLVGSINLMGFYIRNEPSLRSDAVVLTAVMDSSSRLMLGLDFDTKRPTEIGVKNAIQMAINLYEPPIRLITDNGTEFIKIFDGLRQVNIAPVVQSRQPKDLSMALGAIKSKVELAVGHFAIYEPDDQFGFAKIFKQLTPIVKEDFELKVAECVHAYNTKKIGKESPLERYDRQHLGNGYARLLEARQRLTQNGKVFDTHKEFLDYVIEKGLEAI